MNRNILCLLSMAFVLTACSGRKENSQKNDSIALLTDTAHIKVVEEKISILAKKDSTIPSSLSSSELPEEISYKGLYKEGWQWYDLNGKNILILSTQDKVVQVEEIEEGERTRELFARHYVVGGKGMKPELLWELYDVQKDCIFDLTAEFLFSPVITDLDNDRIKESFIAYKLACRSDVSPAKMKIIVHENKNKYALRGIMYVKMNGPEPDTLNTDNWEPDFSKLSVKEEDYTGSWGRYENTKDFAGAPPSFAEQARTLWLENFIEF